MNEREQLQEFNIFIQLHWVEWHSWNSIYDGNVEIPKSAGVYEVKLEFKINGDNERLYIGKSNYLRRRVLFGLVRENNIPHTAGDNIRGNEDRKKLLIRWAETDKPAAAEEELLRLYVEEFGHLPQYNMH